jgi:hypothetical protein
MLSLRAILFLAILSAVFSNLRPPLMINNSPILRGQSKNGSLRAKFLDSLTKTEATFIHNLHPAISSKLTFEALSNLASDDVNQVDKFLLDGFKEEDKHLISKILQKTKMLGIISDSSLVSKLLSEIPSLPAETLVLRPALLHLPSFPFLKTLSLAGPAAVENLISHPTQLKSSKFIKIYNTDSFNVGQNIREDFQNLQKILFHNCESVDFGNFYNKKLKEIYFEGSTRVIVRDAILHETFENGYVLINHPRKIDIPVQHTRHNWIIPKIKPIKDLPDSQKAFYKKDLLEATGNSIELPENSLVMEWTLVR